MNRNLLEQERVKIWTQQDIIKFSTVVQYRLKTLQLEHTTIGLRNVSDRLQMSQVLGCSLEKPGIDPKSDFICDVTRGTANFESVSFARGICWE